MLDVDPQAAHPPASTARTGGRGMIGVICGMEAEAEALGPWRKDPRVFVGVSGARPEKAEALARKAAEAGAQTLFSWGLAGGLSGDLVSGDLICPAAIVLPDGTRAEFGRGMLADVAIAGSDSVVGSVEEKAELRDRTSAIAVDMESHRLAAVAMERGLDLRVIRAISDPWDRALPSLAATALGEDGRPRVGHVAMGLLSRPWQLPDLLAAKRDSDKALKALRGAVDLIAEAVHL